ncbi:unnamed protein product, partial [Mesorhabditis spiculigera]
MGQLYSRVNATFSHYGDASYVNKSYWTPSMESSICGVPCTIFLAIICIIFTKNRGLRQKYQNTISFMTYGCFILGSPIAWYNFMIYTGMNVTGGNFRFTAFSCTFWKILGLTTWYCSFLVPAFLVDLANFFIGTPIYNNTCNVLLYSTVSPVPQLYNAYVLTICTGGVICNFLTYHHIQELHKSKVMRTEDRQLLYSITVQAFAPFFAALFFCSNNLGSITGWYSFPDWVSRPMNKYALIASTLVVPLISILVVARVRKAIIGSLVSSCGLRKLAPAVTMTSEASSNDDNRPKLFTKSPFTPVQ